MPFRASLVKFNISIFFSINYPYITTANLRGQTAKKLKQHIVGAISKLAAACSECSLCEAFKGCKTLFVHSYHVLANDL